MAKWAKKIALWLSITVLAVLLIAAVGIGWLLGTESGRLAAAKEGIAFANSDQLHIDYSGLESPALGEWHIEALKIFKQGTLWIEVKNATVRWSPEQLLQKKLHIKAIHSNYVGFNTDTPPSPATQQDKQASQSSPSVWPVRIDDIQVQDFHLMGVNLPIADRDIRYQIQGQAQLFDEHPVTMSLHASSLSDTKSELNIDSTVNSENSVTVKGSLVEAPQGLFSTLLKLPKAESLDAQFEMLIEDEENRVVLGIESLMLPFVNHQLAATGTVDFIKAPFAVKINQLSLQVDEHKHKIQGAYNAQDLWAKMTLNQFPLDILSPWVPELTQGTVSADAHVSWVHSNPNAYPKGEGKVSASLIYQSQNITGSVTGQFAHPLLTLEHSDIRIEDLHIQGQGVADIQGAQTNLNLDIENFTTQRIQALGAPIPEGISATAKNIQATIKGPIQNPNVNIVTQANGMIHNHAFSVDINVLADKNKANIQKANLSIAGATANVAGLVNWQSGNNDFSADYTNLNTDLIQVAQYFAEMPYPKELTFKATGRTQVKGKLTTPNVQTKTTITGDYRVHGETLPYKVNAEGEVKVATLDQLRATIKNLEVDIFGKPTMTIKGVYHADTIDMQFMLDRMPTQAFALFGLHQIKGKAQADITLTGSIDKPELNGFLNYQETMAISKKQSVPLAWQNTFTTKNRQLTIDSAFIQNGEQSGSMTISLPMDKYLSQRGVDSDFPLHADIKGTQDLRILRWVLDPVLHPVGGKLVSDLTLRGTIGKPSLVGSFEIKNGYYANTLSGIQLDQIHLLAKSDGQVISIHDTTARTGGNGSLQLEGKVNWGASAKTQPDAINLTLTANEATILDRPGIQAQLSGKANLKGDHSDLWLTGTLDLAPLNINIDAATKTPIPEIKVTEVETQKDSEKSASAFPTLHFDLTAKAEQQAFIRGRGLDAELGGQLRLTGTLDKPDYVGRFVTKRGKLDLFNKRFVLQDGEVRFSNQAISMRIPGVYTGKEIEIRLEVYGTADKPKIKLSSVPALPEDEILSRLIFGRSVTDITPFQALRLASAVRTLSEGGGFDPLDKAREKLGLDNVTIDNEKTDDGSGLSVGVGKYINERVYLELERSPNPSQPWNASVEIELTPKITLESSAGTHGKTNTKLLWKNDY